MYVYIRYIYISNLKSYLEWTLYIFDHRYFTEFRTSHTDPLANYSSQNVYYIQLDFALHSYNSHNAKKYINININKYREAPEELRNTNEISILW